MKKIISMLLLAAVLVTLVTGCGSTLKEDEKGATVHMYIANELQDFDPAKVYSDEGAAKLLGLVYEGLTRIGENGKVQKALMKKYKVFEDAEEGIYRMEITIKNTAWSDGRVVSADDVVYAWKRVLDPEFSCAAASLLFDIKNARDVKNGDCSIDDLGIAAVDKTVIEVQFEGKINYDQFLENLACLALVPLREDIVERDGVDAFGTASTTMCSNGPFAVKGLEPKKSLRLERNVYYYRNADKDEGDALDKAVLPYRLEISYDDNDFDSVDAYNINAYENDGIFYLGEISLDKRADYAKEAKITDLLSTHAYIFNTENKLFKSAEVRRGLSMALDRNAVVDIVTFADPATGLVPSPVYDKKVGDSFRKNGGDVISASADVSGAKALIGKASGKFTITCRDNAVELAIAEYCKGVWEDLGYTVTVKSLNYRQYNKAYEAGDYDVIAIDYQSPSTDAFGALSVFALMFSGNGIDLQNQNYDPVPFIPGYVNEDYDAIIEAAFAEKDRAKRSALLHDAEKLLMEDMPIMPIIFNKDAYIYNDDVLSGIGNYYYGYRNFNSLNMKDWREFDAKAAAADTAE